MASLALEIRQCRHFEGRLGGGAHERSARVDLARLPRRNFPPFPLDSVSLLQTRADVLELLSLDRDVDLIIPRGSHALVRFRHRRTAAFPFSGTARASATSTWTARPTSKKAIDVTYDAKVQGPAVCNAAETLLVHEAIAREFLPRMLPS